MLEICIYRLSELLRELLNEISLPQERSWVIPLRMMYEDGPDRFVGRVVS